MSNLDSWLQSLDAHYKQNRFKTENIRWYTSLRVNFDNPQQIDRIYLIRIENKFSFSLSSLFRQWDIKILGSKYSVAGETEWPPKSWKQSLVFRISRQSVTFYWNGYVSKHSAATRWVFTFPPLSSKSWDLPCLPLLHPAPHCSTVFCCICWIRELVVRGVTGWMVGQ